MNDNAPILTHLLQNPEAPVNKQWVLDMLQSHPCFFLPAILLLKRNPQSVDKASLQRMRNIVMMNCADLTAIVDFLDPLNAGWDAFYPKEDVKKSRTEQTIDDFIQRFGHTSTPEEDELLERLIFNPAPADYLAGTDEPFDESDPLVLPPELRRNENSGKKAKKEESTPKEEVSHTQPQTASTEDTRNGPAEHNATETGNEESLLTESLVKIFIKRHNYERALDIISRLSLNYPEKSVYFADQKRFLKKLIINQQYLNKKK